MIYPRQRDKTDTASQNTIFVVFLRAAFVMIRYLANAQNRGSPPLNESIFGIFQGGVLPPFRDR
jgi:hypothetical protein